MGSYVHLQQVEQHCSHEQNGELTAIICKEISLARAMLEASSLEKKQQHDRLARLLHLHFILH